MALTACTAQNPGSDEGAAPEATSGSASEEAPPPCELVAPLDPAALRAASDDGTLDASEAVVAGIDCVEQVVLVPPDDPALAAIATPLAVASQAPLLVGDRDALADLLAELGDPEVRELTRPDGTATSTTDDPDATDDPEASEAADDPEASEAAAASMDALATDVAGELERDRFVAAPADDAAALAGAATLAVRTDAAVLPVGDESTLASLPDDAEVETVGDLSEALPDATRAEQVWSVDEDATTGWLVDPADPAAAPTVTLAALRGDTVVPVSRGDLLARAAVERVRGAGLAADDLVAVGAFAGDPAREVPQLAEAPLLPGGTLRLFDGTRMVAVYGHPGSSALGVLGEQDLDATVERVREVGAGYDADGRDVVPTFEIIASIASAGAGDDGNYSDVGPPEQYQEWVDRAGEEGFQVVLDLQPGRTDFLTQAKVYEDLLREPHVGLALDPEWRLEDDQVHLQQIGGVDAAEVQEVVDWLAELTREEGLTQKLLVLHQFRLSMLRDRDTIEVPPEIAAVVHADGQGPQSVKLETWRTLTAGAEDRWHWGWKNFYDEDPEVAEPGYVLDLEPEVVFVTFQ